jgi:hypothetical protein
MPRHRTILILLVLLGSLAFGLYGCGKITPTASEEEDLTAPPAEPLKNAFPAEVLWPKMLVSCDTVYVDGVISEYRWSFLNLDLPGRYHSFIVPSGAVDQRTTITIAVVRNTYWDEDNQRWSYMAEFDFGPDGLVFDPDRQPKLIIDAVLIDLHNGDEAVLRFYRQDTDLWEEISDEIVERNKVSFYIPHFSLYAIS